MAAQVVDELIVTLSLDAENYRKAEKTVEQSADRTFRKQQERARVTDRTNRDQQKRLKDVAAGVKSFALQVTAAVGVVTGLGVAIGGTLGGFLSFQTALRRQTVGTGLSNKEMQAWSATARRMGADANAGAEAIANLAKERQQIGLGMPAPTLAALGKMGVNIDPARPLQDVLAQAQRIYKNAPAGQRQQYENTLSAQGVSNDLILMIKSEQDVREVFTKSLSQSTEANEKALAKLADAFESIKATSVTVAGTLLEVLEPAIKAGGEKLAEWAVKLAEFTKDLQDAGGGVDGFTAALDKNAPVVTQVLRTFGDVISVINNEIRKTSRGFGQLGELLYWILNRVRAPWGSKGLVDDAQQRIRDATGTQDGQTVAQNIGQRLRNWWGATVADSRAMDLAEGRTGFAGIGVRGKPGMPPGSAAGQTGGAQGIMQKLITQYGLTVQQAAAVVANWSAESNLNPTAFNKEGGGNGARGIAQWRGPRIEAFRRMYGKDVLQGSLDEQINFAMTDPTERARMMRSFAPGGDAQRLGTSYSKIYETHMNLAEDLERGRKAKVLESAYRGAGAGTSSGNTVNIQNMTVQSNNPTEWAGGLQRLDGTQPYNSVIR